MQRKTLIGLALAAAAALGGGTATGAETADQVLLPGEKLRELLSSAGETKTVAVAGLEGGVLSVIAKATRGSRVRPTLHVRGPDGVVVDLTDYGKTSSKKAQVKKLPLTATGVWRVGVRTASGSGGEFELVTKQKLRTKFTFTGTLANTTAELVYPFQALPGTTLKLKVTPKGKPVFQPLVEIESPSGVTVATAPAPTKKPSASLKNVVLPELGTYLLRVRGGPGSFKAALKLKAMSPKSRQVTFRQVEALPAVFSIAPDTVANDGERTINMDGFGFTGQQQFALMDGNRALRTASPYSIRDNGATIDLDLEDIAPGTYGLRAVTGSGRSADLDLSLTVTNRTPSVLRASPSDAPWGDVISLELDGAGFDTDVEMNLRRSDGGELAPGRLIERVSSERIRIEVEPEDFAVGKYDVEISDPSGGSSVASRIVDVLGFDRAPRDFDLYSDSPGSPDRYHPRDAAYNDDDDYVLVSVQDGSLGVRFILFSATTLAEIGRVELPGNGSSTHSNPRVAWNPVDGTFALAWVEWTPSELIGRLVITADDDLDDVIVNYDLSTVPTATGRLDEVNVTPDRVGGGWMVVWAEDDGVLGELVTQPIEPDGTAGVQRAIYSHPLGYIWTPVVEQLANNRFLVIHVGANNDDFYFAMRRMLIDRDGVAVSQTGIVATSPNWFNVFQPELAQDPNDATVLLAFTYMDQDGLFHPASKLFEGPNAQARALITLDGGGDVPIGFVDSLVWNAERNEFVAALTSATTEPGSNKVIVRRLGPEDGRIKATSQLLTFEGIWGILYAGSEPGTLGMVRRSDGDDTDGWERYSEDGAVRGASMR